MNSKRISEYSLGELLVVALHPLSFVIALVWIWCVFVELPRYLYLWRFFRSGVHRILVIEMIFFRFIAPIQTAFYLSVVIQLLSLAKRGVAASRGRIIPPYEAPPEPVRRLPARIQDSVYPLEMKKRMVKSVFPSSFVLYAVIAYAFYREIQWNHNWLIAWIDRLPSDYLFAAFSIIFSAPLQRLTNLYFNPMNELSLVGLLLLVWIPAIPLTIGFLNLNSYVTEILRKGLFLNVRFLSHQIRSSDSSDIWWRD